MPNPHRFSVLWALLAAAGLSVAVGAPAGGQEPESSRLLLPEDLDAAGRLAQIEELAQRGQWDKVVLGLDRLLSEGGGRLVRGKEGFTSVKAAARQRILSLSGRALAAYLLAHEEEAETLLGIGRRSPRPDPFERIVAEHPGTPQVGSARQLLANRYLERGDFGAALVHLEGILADTREVTLAPEAQRLRALTYALLGRRGAALSALDQIAGEVSEAEREALRARIEVALGGARDEAEVPPSPGALAWRRPVFGYYETETGGSAPWSQPQSDGASVYVQDGSHAQAIDLATGRIRWRTPLGDVDAFIRPEGTCTLALGRGVVVCAEARRVTAFDQQTGRRLWQRPLAGLQRQAEVDFDAALGVETPPSVVGGVVVLPLVTQHQDREVHLLGLDLDTGGLAWSVFVASETGGAVPRPGLAAEGGRCFVVTGHGAVAAVDAQGELLWLRTYTSRRDKKDGPRGPFGLRPERGQQAEPETGPGSSLALAGGLLWIAPSDGKGFVALDPAEGTQRGSHEAKSARLLGARGLAVVGLSEPSKGAARLALIERSKLSAVCELPGDVADQRVAWAGDSIYAASGQELRVCGFAGGEPVRHALSGPAGNPLVAGGRIVLAAPAGVDAYGLAARGEAPSEDAASILAALSDPRFLTREAASSALLTSESPVSREQLAGLVAGEGEGALRATIALGELERRERLVLWRPLAKQGWEDAVPDLLNRLTHPNPEVRLQGLVALGKLSDPDVNALMVQLTEDRDSRVAFRAAGVLLTKGDRRGMALVAAALGGSLPLSDRLQAGELLFEHGQPVDAELALPALADADPGVRALALKAALKLSEGRLLERVEHLARDKEPEVRLALIEGIADLVTVNARAKAIVTDAITDPDDRVRLLVVQRLADLKTIDACRVLCLALGDSVSHIATLAGKAVNSQLVKRGISAAERARLTLAILDPRGLEAGSKHKEALNRNIVAQFSLRYLDAGGRLSIETITRFMTDSRQEIRSSRIGGTPWGQFLLNAVDGQALGTADVAAIASLALSTEINPRIQAYQFLAEAGSAPGRGEILAQGLADENASIRRDVAAWLLPGDPNKPSLIDLSAARAILLIAVGAEREEGRTAAREVLKNAGRERLAPHLIELVKDPALEGAAWTLAVETLSALTEGAVPFDYGATRAELGMRFQRWWFKVVHGDEGGDELASALKSSNPSERFMAARKAAKLPTPGMRRALILSLEGENTGWVLKEKLMALVTVSGRSFGFEKTMKLPELLACAERFMAWERAGAPAEEGQ